MSRDNVEIAREAMELIRRAGSGEPKPRLFELLASDMTLDMSRRRFNPDVYEGHAGPRRFRERDEIWGVRGHRGAQDRRRRECGGDRIAAWARQDSGAETSVQSTSVWNVRDGRVIRMAAYYDQRDFLKAAGLKQ